MFEEDTDELDFPEIDVIIGHSFAEEKVNAKQIAQETGIKLKKEIYK